MTRLVSLGIAFASSAAALQPPLARRAFLSAPARRSAPVDAVAAPVTTLRKKAAARVLGGLVGAAASLAPGAALAKGGGYGASSAPSSAMPAVQSKVGT